MPLAWLAQDDFGAGAVRSDARHKIPANGAYSIENGLIDSDGLPFRRGRSSYLSTAFGAGGLRWVWDGHFAAGRRTLFANTTDFGVLAGDGSVVNLGGAGLTDPVRAVQVGGMLFIPGGTIYAGSRKAADYSGGVISVTQGSRAVLGSGGTTFATDADAGMLLRVGGTGRYYVVDSVDNNTNLTLVDEYEGATAAGVAYELTRLGSAVAPYRFTSIYATVAERLVSVAAGRVRFSAGRSELGVPQPHVFDDTDYHELMLGAKAIGAEGLGDLLLVFATDGVWTISNMAFDLTDAAGNVQQQMRRYNEDLVLWGQPGVAGYRGALVVPALDGNVYLVDGVSQPARLSESITPLLRDHITAGHKPGGGHTFRDHYFLPVLDSMGVVVDQLVCRLDRPVAGGRDRTFFAWTWLRGHASKVTSFATRVEVGALPVPDPVLIGAGEDGRLLSLSRLLRPAGEVDSTGLDADGSGYSLVLETRDFPTGRGNVNTVRRARVHYELTGTTGGDPVLTASYSTGGSFVALSGSAPEDSGTGRHTWLLQAEGRYFRLRLESTGPAARLTVRNIELAVRESGKDR